MKKLFLILIMLVMMLGTVPETAHAQCSICTRNVQQLGERPAKALNAGIIYLALAPLAIFAIIGYRWWKANGESSSA
jgi:TRAP-type C4-dicarboxylate transport system permease small subunit